MRTQGRFEQDTPFADAKIILHPEDILVSGTAAITRNAASDWSINQAASLTVNYGIPFSKVMERLGQQLLLQEQYGGANQPINAPGLPPFTGMSQLNSQVGNILKGFKLTDVTFAYLVTGAALTSQSFVINKLTYANNAAIASAVVLAAGANGLQTAVQASPYVTKILTPNAVFNQTDNSEYLGELTVVTPASSAFRLYRVIMHGQFNYN